MLINVNFEGKDWVSPSAGVEFLQSLGLEVKAIGGQELEVGGERLRMHTRQRVPSPAELKRQAAPNSIYFLPRVSKGLRDFAKANKTISLVASRTKEFWHKGKQLSAPSTKEQDKAQNPRAPWARFGLLRTFALSPKPRTQAELAKSLWITQAAVSQNLATLKHLIEKTKGGWRAKEFDLVAKEFLDTYPGAGGVERYWYSIDPVPQQVKRVAAERPEAILSGDFAADLLAPWRMPDLGVFYSNSDLQLQKLGFISTTLDKATLIEIIPADRTIWPLSQKRDGRLLADSLLVASDMKRSKGVDSTEAIERLLTKLRKDWQINDH